jgi:hypothetical protein
MKPSEAGIEREANSMTQHLSYVAILLGATALACTDATPPIEAQGGQAGSGGQTTAGSGGMPQAGSTTTGGTPGGGTGGGSAGTPSTAGAAGAAGGGAGGLGGGGAGGSAGGGGAGGADGWIPLFNGTSLEGWTASPGDGALFAAGELEGQGVIHVYPTQEGGTNQPEATLRTNESFSKYVFHIQYKWGTKRFVPRANDFRDNGICFHLCGDLDQVWPESIELQIGAATSFPHDWITGNIFMLINKTRAQWPYTTMGNNEVWSATGTKKSIGAPTSYYRALVPEQRNVDDDWNTIELTVNGSEKAEYKVNGTVVNEVFDMECNENGTWAPLTQGPIALQAEYAEIYFRDVRIKMLP